MTYGEAMTAAFKRLGESTEELKRLEGSMTKASLRFPGFQNQTIPAGQEEATIQLILSMNKAYSALRPEQRASFGQLLQHEADKRKENN